MDISTTPIPSVLQHTNMNENDYIVIIKYKILRIPLLLLRIIKIFEKLKKVSATIWINI